MNILTPSEVLEVAIAHERGVTRLAQALSTDEYRVKQNIISAWRARGLNHPGWLLALRLKYKKQLKQAADDRATKTTGVVSSESGASHV